MERLSVGRFGCSGGLAPSRLARLRADYRTRSLASLPGLLDGELLSWALDALDATVFLDSAIADDPRLLKASGPADASIDAALSFLFNDPVLFRAVQAIADGPPIRGFSGRVLRLSPGRGHYVNWHCDDPGPASRIVGLRLNLSRAPFTGGRLQVRKLGERAVLAEYDSNVCGDAALFRSAPDIEHRNTAVTGRVARTTFSGWFHRDEVRERKSAGASPLADALVRGGGLARLPRRKRHF